MPTKQSQPNARRVLYGNLYHGSWTVGIHTAPIGSAMTLFGMKRNAIMLVDTRLERQLFYEIHNLAYRINAQANRVCTILSNKRIML